MGTVKDNYGNMLYSGLLIFPSFLVFRIALLRTTDFSSHWLPCFFSAIIIMSIRRNARMRREYLYRKSLEGKEREAYEKKRKIKEALASGRPIPKELRNESLELKREIGAEDVNTARLKETIDDEYGLAGVQDPKLLVTTARDPPSRLHIVYLTYLCA
eukprot:g47559.t1